MPVAIIWGRAIHPHRRRTGGDRIDIEQTLLKLEQEQQQTEVLQQLDIAVRGQQQSRNQIDQRIRLLELMQSMRPNVEVFVSAASNTAGLARVA